MSKRGGVRDVVETITNAEPTDSLEASLPGLTVEQLAQGHRTALGLQSGYQVRLERAREVIQLIEKQLALRLEPRGEHGTLVQAGSEKVVYWVRTEAELLHLQHVVLGPDQ